MSNRNRLILVTSGFVVVALLLYLFLVKPRSAEVDDLAALVAAEEVTTQTLQTQVQQLEALKEDAPRLEEELKTVRGFVPIKSQVDRFIDQIEKRAKEAGVDFVEVTPEVPKSPPEGASIAQIRLSIGASGTFFSLNDFVRLVYDMPRAIRIDLLSLEADQTGTAVRILNLRATARIFFELPAAGAAPQPAPGATPEPPPGETS